MIPHLQHDNPVYRRAATALAVFVEEAFRQSSDDSAPSPTEYTVMRAVAQFGDDGVPISDLCSMLEVSAPSLRGIVAGLVDKKMLMREDQPAGTSDWMARITEAGVEALKSDPLESAFEQLFDRIDEEECRRLHDMLVRTDRGQERARALMLGLEFWR